MAVARTTLNKRYSRFFDRTTLVGQRLDPKGKNRPPADEGVYSLAEWDLCGVANKDPGGGSQPPSGFN